MSPHWQSMAAQGSLHSMSRDDRSFALEVLSGGWAHLATDAVDLAEHRIVVALAAAASALSGVQPHVDADYAAYLVEAAVWYLDRAVRRVADPDRDGLTALQRTANLDWFGATASAADLERLFAMAAALNADDA